MFLAKKALILPAGQLKRQAALSCISIATRQKWLRFLVFSSKECPLFQYLWLNCGSILGPQPRRFDLGQNFKHMKNGVVDSKL